MSFRRLIRNLRTGAPDPFLALRAPLSLEEAAARCAALLLLLLGDGADDASLELELSIAGPGPYTSTLRCVGQNVWPGVEARTQGGDAKREIERAAHDAIRAATPRSWALPLRPLATPAWCRAAVTKDGKKEVAHGRVLRIAVSRPCSAHARLAAIALLERDDRTAPGRLARLWGLVEAGESPTPVPREGSPG